MARNAEKAMVKSNEGHELENAAWDALRPYRQTRCDAKRRGPCVVASLGRDLHPIVEKHGLMRMMKTGLDSLQSKLTTLARWRAAQVQEVGGQRERRPYLASECNDLQEAEKWRLQIVREIAKKVAQIQNAGLGEFRIRDLNDEINKLMREKRHWEVQIKSLGGPDHARVGPKMLDQDGKEVPGNRGYKYFGAAKDLPGVRELFEQEPPAPPRRTRADLMRDVDADYYGYRDDDDGLLLPLEQRAENEAIARAVEEWKSNKEENKEQEVPEEEDIYPEDPEDKRLEEEDAISSHVAVPSQKDIEEALLTKKKRELLEKYGCLHVKMES